MGFDHLNFIQIPLHLSGSGAGGPKSAQKCICGVNSFFHKMPIIHKSCLKTCFWRCWRSGYRVATDFPAARPRSGTSEISDFVFCSYRKIFRAENFSPRVHSCFGNISYAESSLFALSTKPYEFIAQIDDFESTSEISSFS